MGGYVEKDTVEGANSELGQNRRDPAAVVTGRKLGALETGGRFLRTKGVEDTGEDGIGMGRGRGRRNRWWWWGSVEGCEGGCLIGEHFRHHGIVGFLEGGEIGGIYRGDLGDDGGKVDGWGKDIGRGRRGSVDVIRGRRRNSCGRQW